MCARKYVIIWDELYMKESNYPQKMELPPSYIINSYPYNYILSQTHIFAIIHIYKANSLDKLGLLTFMHFYVDKGKVSGEGACGVLERKS